MSQHQQQAPPSFIGTYHTVESANAALAAAVRASNNGEINLVTPAPEVHYLPPMTAIMLRMYRPSRDQLFGVGGGRDAFTRGFIDVLGKAMRLQVVDARRTDDGSDGAVCSFAVVVAQPTFEGGQIMHVGNKTMNLQDDSPASAKMGKGLATARAFIAEHAETKAPLRVFRTAIHIGAVNRRPHAREQPGRRRADSLRPARYQGHLAFEFHVLLLYKGKIISFGAFGHRRSIRM